MPIRRLLGQIFRHLTAPEGRLPTDWVAGHVARLDRNDGDIDTLMARIAHIRTWTYISHRAGWLADPGHWQEASRAVEDKLSDALHRVLTQRFVDRRQAHLLRRMKDGNALVGSVTRAGEVIVEGHGVGQLAGFRFIPDGSGGVEESRPLLNAARRALAREIPERLARLEGAPDAAFALSAAGVVSWEGAPVARLDGRRSRHPAPGRSAAKRSPGQRPARAAAPAPGPLVGAFHRPPAEAAGRRRGSPVTGATRGVLFQLIEALGLLPRRELSAQLPLADAKALSALGLRLGRESVWFPALASSGSLAGLLWCIHAGRAPTPLPPRRPPSLLRDPALPAEFYHAVGYRLAGSLAIRADALERLSQAARRLAGQGPFLPVEALRQTHPMRGGRFARGHRGAGLPLGRGRGRATLPCPGQEGGRQGCQAPAPARPPAAAAAGFPLRRLARPQIHPMRSLVSESLQARQMALACAFLQEPHAGRQARRLGQAPDRRNAGLQGPSRGQARRCADISPGPAYPDREDPGAGRAPRPGAGGPAPL